MKCTIFSLFAVSSVFTAAVVNSAAAELPRALNYHQVARFAVGGEGGWDYLIAGPGHRVFVSRGTHVMVVDGDTGKVVGDVPGTGGVHGIAFSTRLNRGYTSNGRDNSVTVFNLSNYKVIRTIPITGKNPDCIIFEPVTQRVLTFNGASGDVSVIDTETDKEIGKVAIGGKLEFAASDSSAHVFVNNESSSEIYEFSARRLNIINKWSIAPAEGPSGIALDSKHHRLFSVTDGKMVVSDTQAGRVVTTVDIGNGPDAAAFDPSRGLVFSSNGESGTLTIVKEINPSTFKVEQTVKTEEGARTMAYDPGTKRVYLVTARFAPAAPEGSARRRRQMLPNSFTMLVFAP